MKRYYTLLHSKNLSLVISLALILTCCFSCSPWENEGKGDFQSIEKQEKSIDEQIHIIDSLKRQSQLAEALQAMDSAIKISNKSKNYRLYHLLHNKAATLHSIGEEVQALNLFQRCLEIARNKKNKVEEFKALSNIGILNSRIKNYDRALGLFDEAIAYYWDNLSVEQRNRYSLSPIYNSKGSIFLKQGKLDSALTYFRLSVKNQEHIIAKIAFYNNASNVYREKKEFDSAHVYIDKAIALSTNQKNKGDLAFALVNKSKIFTNQKKYTEAYKMLEQSKKLADSSNFQLANHLKEAILLYHAEKKEFKEAYFFQNEWIQFKNRAEVKEKNKRVVTLTLLYDLKGKAERIRSLQFEDKLKATKIENQKTIILWSVLAILILSALVYLYAKKLKQIVALNKKLVAKNLAIAHSEKTPPPNNLQDIPKEKNMVVFESNNELHQKLIESLEEFSKDRVQICDNDMTLAHLAKKLATNQKYLSSVINQHYHCNFSTFLNERRIKESCLMLTESAYKNYSIEAISKEAGFTSKSVFNKAFKKYTGVTPSVFLKYGKIK